MQRKSTRTNDAHRHWRQKRIVSGEMTQGASSSIPPTDTKRLTQATASRTVFVKRPASTSTPPWRRLAMRVAVFVKLPAPLEAYGADTHRHEETHTCHDSTPTSWPDIKTARAFARAFERSRNRAFAAQCEYVSIYMRKTDTLVSTRKKLYAYPS